MELKHLPDPPGPRKIRRLNRTIVELKLSTAKWRDFLESRLNRTIVELKRSLLANLLERRTRLNRTIVELKHEPVKTFYWLARELESNHRGIETDLSLACRELCKLA